MINKYEQVRTVVLNNGAQINCFITTELKFCYKNGEIFSELFDSLLELQSDLEKTFGRYEFVFENHNSKLIDKYITLLEEKVENERFVI